jgi:hypothetical protein
MATLKEIVQAAMAGYAVKGLNGYNVLTATPAQDLMTIVSVAMVKGHRITTTTLIAHIQGDVVVIEADANNKPLVDALVQAGLPRSQIILAYAGEPVPEAV